MNSRHFFPTIEKIINPPTCLVAGGAGFIGSHLCEKLLSLKTRVICLDSLVTGKKGNLINCLSNENFSFLEQEITQPLKNLDFKIDYIFHLVGLEEFLENKELELTDLMANSTGTKNLLDLAVKQKAKFLLGSIINVYLAQLSSKSIDNQFSAIYSHAEAKRYSEALVTEYYRKFNLDIRIVRLADVFGSRMNLSSGTPISEFFKAVVFNNDLKIKGEGLTSFYPSYVSDVVDGLTKAIFKSNTNGKVYNLLGEKISHLNFSYLLRQIKPDLKIVFTKKEEELEINNNYEELIKTTEEIGWQKEDLKKSAKETIDSFINQASKEEVTMPKPAHNVSLPVLTNEPIINNPVGKSLPEVNLTSKKKTKRFSFFASRLRIFLLGIIIILGITLFPLFSLLWNSFIGISQIQAIEKNKIIKSLDNTINMSLSASQHFNGASKSLNSYNPIFSLFKITTLQDKYQTLFLVAENSSLGVYHSLNATKNLSSLLKTIGGETNNDIQGQINDSQLEFKLGQENFSLALANLKELRQGQLSSFNLLGKKIDLLSYENKISQLKSDLSDLESLAKVAPRILGTNTRQTYLILFQNNMELRPTGGFIGSYALAMVENGKLIDFKIEDVYAADGQLKGKVNPPDEILHYLGQPNWYLRDSNFSPDFELSAQRASWFLEKEMGVSTDGVIGINLSMAQKLLKAVGEVSLPDYKDKITADNLFTKAETQSEIDFFPGSTQKKNFLSAVGKALFDKLTNAEEKDYAGIADALISGLKEKDLLLYFNDAETETILSKLNYAGKIILGLETVDQGITNDYLMVVDSNFGANKANYFVDRKVRQEINIGKVGEIYTTVYINYKNNSPTDSWPGGVYKNYVRLLVPKEANFVSADINENKKSILVPAVTEEELKALSDKEFLVIEASESARKSWGTFINVPVGKSKEISFTYRLPGTLSFDENNLAQYQLYVQKQPGITRDHFELVFGYPSYLTVVDKGQGIEKTQVVDYNTSLLTDQQFLIKLRR